MSVFGLLGAKEIVNEKVSMLKEELQKDGYNPRWFIISQKRHPLFNEILKNSVKNSKHLTGNAIDLFIIDINDDGMYNQTDFTIMKNVSHECDKVNPSVRGNLYNYLDRGFLSCNMVHLEVE